MDPASSAVSVLSPTSGATSMLYSERPVTNERHSLVRKCPRDAGGVGPSAGTPLVGVPNPSDSGD